MAPIHACGPSIAETMSDTASPTGRPAVSTTSRSRLHGSYCSTAVFGRVGADDLGFQDPHLRFDAGGPPGVPGDGEQIGGDLPGDDVTDRPQRTAQCGAAHDRLLDRVDPQEGETRAARQFHGAHDDQQR
ncbi:hypothetical protein [Amycolatopsis plumensis]|uniref:Uncharacterized protein n=1 Tax=Amycolatopsis plumensis TaxID=236508 RepID=A0ABV5UA91_9PSEU